MHTDEQRQFALDLYFAMDTKMFVSSFVDELGYPLQRTMSYWIRNDPRHTSDTRPRQSRAKQKKKKGPKYTEEQRQFALDLYFSLDPLMPSERFIENIGYPSLSLFLMWRRNDPRYDPDTDSYKAASLETKLEAVKRYGKGQSAGSIAKKLGLGNKNSVYSWYKAWKRKGALGLIPERKVLQLSDEIRKENDSEKNKISRPSNKATSPIGSTPDIDDLPDDPQTLKAIIADLQLDLAISKEVLDVLKVDPRTKTGELTNKEKTVITRRLESSFPLITLLNKLNLKRSTYYYNLEALSRPDKYINLRTRIACIFKASDRTWGSERIWARLRQGDNRHYPIIISEKVVRKIMAEEDCVVIYNKKPKQRYSSYEGEISKAPKNIVERNFHATKANVLWLTDITEFKLPDAPKVYLSAIIDCLDGKPIAWKSGLRPSKELANETLIAACVQKTECEHPVIHSDRGCHYRWPEWIRICNENGLIRSMSKKGCSPDNAAMEGFWGTVKNEFFYHRDWSGTTAEQFIEQLNEYLCYHCEERIKKSLDWMSPNQYRQLLQGAA